MVELLHTRIDQKNNCLNKFRNELCSDQTKQILTILRKWNCFSFFIQSFHLVNMLTQLKCWQNQTLKSVIHLKFPQINFNFSYGDCLQIPSSFVTYIMHWCRRRDKRARPQGHPHGQATSNHGSKTSNATEALKFMTVFVGYGARRQRTTVSHHVRDA